MGANAINLGAVHQFAGSGAFTAETFTKHIRISFEIEQQSYQGLQYKPRKSEKQSANAAFARQSRGQQLSRANVAKHERKQRLVRALKTKMRKAIPTECRGESGYYDHVRK